MFTGILGNLVFIDIIGVVLLRGIKFSRDKVLGL